MQARAEAFRSSRPVDVPAVGISGSLKLRNKVSSEGTGLHVTEVIGPSRENVLILYITRGAGETSCLGTRWHLFAYAAKMIPGLRPALTHVQHASEFKKDDKEEKWLVPVDGAGTSGM